MMVEQLAAAKVDSMDTEMVTMWALSKDGYLENWLVGQLAELMEALMRDLKAYLKVVDSDESTVFDLENFEAGMLMDNLKVCELDI